MIPPEAVNVEDIADTALPESTVSSARTTGTERICKPLDARSEGLRFHCSSRSAPKALKKAGEQPGMFGDG